MNLWKYLICFIVIVSPALATDNYYTIYENELTINTDYKVIFADNIYNYSVDNTTVYVSTKDYIYSVNKTIGTINYKSNIPGIKDFILSDNFIYAYNSLKIYKIHKINGTLDTLRFKTISELFSDSPISSTGSITNNYYVCTNCTNGTNGINGTNGYNGSDGINGINGTNGTNAIFGSLTYILHNISSDVTTYSSLKMDDIIVPDVPKTERITTPISNGDTLIQNWTSLQINLTLIPAGIISLHIHANKVSSGGAHVDRLWYDVGIVNSTGDNYSSVGISGYSNELTTDELEYTIDGVMLQRIVNATDRMALRLYVNQTGSGSLPEIKYYMDDLTVSSMRFPAIPVDLTSLINQVTTNTLDITTKVNKTGDNLSGNFWYGYAWSLFEVNTIQARYFESPFFLQNKTLCSDYLYDIVPCDGIGVGDTLKVNKSGDTMTKSLHLPDINGLAVSLSSNLTSVLQKNGSFHTNKIIKYINATDYDISSTQADYLYTYIFGDNPDVYLYNLVTFQSVDNVGFPYFLGRRARGTHYSNGTAQLLPLQDGDTFMRFGGTGYTNNAWQGTKATIDYITNGAWTSTSTGTDMLFRTTKNGSTTMVDTAILSDANLTVYTLAGTGNAILQSDSTGKLFANRTAGSGIPIKSPDGADHCIRVSNLNVISSTTGAC